MTSGRDKSLLGMWIFLATEALLFSALFLVLIVLRQMHPTAFVDGVSRMNLGLGALNTAILLTSSWVVAGAMDRIETAERRRTARRLMIAATLGTLFLVIKGFEYAEHIRDHLLPGSGWHPVGPHPQGLELFFALYFVITAVHAIHLFIGVVLMIVFALRELTRAPENSLRDALENAALYWHFVDVIWVFLFAVLYASGGS